jgi:hypothetical protein
MLTPWTQDLQDMLYRNLPKVNEKQILYMTLKHSGQI